MRVVLYCRVSSDIQREAGTTESQIDCAREYFAAFTSHQFLKLTKMMAFRERSRWVSAPREGSRTLADARIGKFDTVLVFRIDRLARRTSDLLNTVELLRECGVALRSTD